MFIVNMQKGQTLHFVNKRILRMCCRALPGPFLNHDQRIVKLFRNVNNLSRNFIKLRAGILMKKDLKKILINLLDLIRAFLAAAGTIKGLSLGLRLFADF